MYLAGCRNWQLSVRVCTMFPTAIPTRALLTLAGWTTVATPQALPKLPLHYVEGVA